MKSKLTMCVLAVTLLAGAAFAQAPAAKPAKHAKATATKHMHTRVATGSIVSVDESKLVLSHKVKGKAQEMSFDVNANTRKMGSLKSGAKATVHYKIDNGSNVATSVTAKG